MAHHDIRKGNEMNINNKFVISKYRKIPIISPGLIFVQKAFLLGLFSGKLLFGGAYYWKEFCIPKWVGLDNKNSLALTVHGLIYSGGFIIGRIFASEIWGAYLREGLLLFFFGGEGGLIIGISW